MVVNGVSIARHLNNQTSLNTMFFSCSTSMLLFWLQNKQANITSVRIQTSHWNPRRSVVHGGVFASPSGQRAVFLQRSRRLRRRGLRRWWGGLHRWTLGRVLLIVGACYIFSHFHIFSFTLSSFLSFSLGRGGANEAPGNATFSHEMRVDRQKLKLNCDLKTSAATILYEMTVNRQKLQ